ncbi:hypothetical protein RJI07_07160 [Mycoplasmatota bacterium WC30]
MKRIILILTVIMFSVTFASCSTKETNTSGDYLWDEQISAIPANYDFESVIEESSDIFIGELINVRRGTNLNDNIAYGDPLRVTAYIEYEFKVKEVIFSEYNRNPETIKVYYHDLGAIEMDLGYNPLFNCTYYSEYEYLLPVKITDKAYYKNDVYHVPGNMVLSLNQCISEYSSLMGKHSILLENGNDLAKEIDKSELLSYVNKLISGKRKQNSYTGEIDIIKISDFSTNIFKVRVLKLIQIRSSDVAFGETYTIEILETIKKGSYDYDAYELKVDFIGETVKPGDIVYVGLDSGSNRYGETGIYFDLTSKILFTSSQINQIKQHIGSS